ncbi:MAG: 16S rRNA (guanine(527)-N(7))-methyltransferase RsmG [Treponema sp.]|jgi:16S rRNA (guanine527-N7)-methyltransferase|nr:16S rRNA (guanine(527)-N(7))-methyltransferase RsmG [Treponema sp.]
MLAKADTVLEAGLLRLRELPRVDALLSFRAVEVRRLLTLYIEEIERFNPIYGLVGVRNREELVIKHILDALSPLGILQGFFDRLGEGLGPQAAFHVADVGSGAGLQGKPATFHVADVGSGAGLPGIPLAIALPEVTFTLIERMRRRANFLRNALAVLGLPNVTVEEAEMENTRGKRFDLVVFRAFSPLEPSVIASLFRLLTPRGIVAAYKGRRVAVEEELAKIVGCGEILPCPVPFLDEERHLALLWPEGSPNFMERLCLLPE